MFNKLSPTMVDPIPQANNPHPEPDEGGQEESCDLGPELSPELLHRTALAIGTAKHLMTQVSVKDWVFNLEESKKIIIGEEPLTVSFDYNANLKDPVIRIKTPAQDIEITPGNPWVQELPALAALLCKEYFIQSAKDALDALETDWQDLRDLETSFRITKSTICRKLADGYCHAQVTEQEVHLERGDGVVSFLDEDSVNFPQVTKLEYGKAYSKEKVALFNKFTLPLLQENPEVRRKVLTALETQAREETARKFCNQAPDSLGPRKTNLIYSNQKIESLMAIFGADPIKLRYEIPSDVLLAAIARMKHWSVNIVSHKFLFIDETAPQS